MISHDSRERHSIRMAEPEVDGSEYNKAQHRPLSPVISKLVRQLEP